MADPIKMAEVIWASDWRDIVPLSGRALPFAVDAKAGGALHFRFASPRARAAWGFVAKAAVVSKERVACYPKGLSNLAWLNGEFAELAKDAFVRKATGTYRLGLAAGNLVEVFLRSETPDFQGRFVFEKSVAGGWECHRPEAQAPMAAAGDLARLVKDLHRLGTIQAIVPKDPLELSLGYRLLDVAKTASSMVTIRSVLKASAEQRYTLGVAYPVKEVDAHGEYASAEEVEKAAWKFMQSPKVGLMHRSGTDGAGLCVESYIYRGPEWKVDGQEVGQGDWLLGVVWGEEAWGLIKSGTITGFSIQGWAKRA